MWLRNILYVDINALDNYISQIDGYTYEEETIVESGSNIKDGKIGVGISKVSAEGKAEKERAEAHTRNAKVTDESNIKYDYKYKLVFFVNGSVKRAIITGKKLSVIFLFHFKIM